MRHFTLAEIADCIGGVIEAPHAALKISGVKPLAEAHEGDITLATKRADILALEQTLASAALVPARVGAVHKPTIRVQQPRLAFAQLLEMFYCSREREVTGVDPRAVVAPSVRIGREVNIAAGAYVAQDVEIGDRVDIYPGVYLGEAVRVGDDSVLFANVSVYPGTIIGKRVRIHSGAVIGSDGFGYARDRFGTYHKIPQVGRVEVGDDVEIGANTTIDRGTLTLTRIGKGTKVDNLVQIAHNVIIGDHVCIVAQSGIAGSVHIGDRVVLAAGAGLVDHITVAEGARVGARAGVTKDVAAGMAVAGTPAIPLQEAVRAYPLIERLPEYRRMLRDLERRCARLETELNRHSKRA